MASALVMLSFLEDSFNGNLQTSLKTLKDLSLKLFFYCMSVKKPCIGCSILHINPPNNNQTNQSKIIPQIYNEVPIKNSLNPHHYIPRSHNDNCVLFQFFRTILMQNQHLGWKQYLPRRISSNFIPRNLFWNYLIL